MVRVMPGSTRIVGAVACVVACLTLSACTPPIAYAWKLNPDDTISIATCSHERASRLEVRYFRDGHPTSRFVAEGSELEVGEGREVAFSPESWLVAPPDVESLSEGDSVSVTLLAAPFPQGTVQLKNAGGEMIAVVDRQIDRSKLRLGEWIWDETGLRCDLTTEPLDQPYTGALNRPTYEVILTENPDADSLVDALVKLDRVAPILAFQAMLIDDLKAADDGSGSLADALETAHPGIEPDVVYAAGLAVARLGFVWRPGVVEGNEWATSAFPDSVAFTG